MVQILSRSNCCDCIGDPDATNGRRAWTETRLRTNWAKACQTALGRHLPLFASMKHTFATNVIARGGSEGDRNDYLGHREIRSTRHYVRAAKQRYVAIQSLGLTGPGAGNDTKSETGTDSER